MRHFKNPTALPLSLLSVATIVSGTQLTGPSTPVPAEYFGMHIHKAARAGLFRPTQGSLGRQGASAAPTSWPNVSFRSWRLWDAGVDWSELEPAKDQWQFELLDKYVDLARRHDVEILLTLGQTPAWASTRPNEKKAYQSGNAAEPRSLDDWRNYVRTVATRYKGSIRAYEIWNEPNLKIFYTGTIQDMSVLTREAFTVLKKVDPSILVVSASVTGDFRWLGEYLGAGAAKYIDVVGFHFYTAGSPEEVVGLARRVKQVMTDNGIPAKPLWNTEGGWGRTSSAKVFSSDNQAAAYVARSYILDWVTGISRFYWYAWDNFWWVTLNMTGPDRQTEKPAAQAYRVTQRWLVGAVMKSCQTNTEGTWQCELDRGGSRNVIVWNPDHPGTFSIPSGWKPSAVTDARGITRSLTERNVIAGESPVLIQ